MNSPKIIFHIDINAFYASVEANLDSSLINKSIAVAHNDPLHRGIILSPNYNARNKGVKTTMSVKEAKLLVNDLIIVEPKMAKYKEYSNKFVEYLKSITEQVEVASIDEAYMDVSDLYTKVHPIDLAKIIQSTLFKKFGLPTSIGIATNKFLAKMGSDFKKPMGITIIRKREIDKLLWPLPIGRMYGVGKKTKEKLEKLNINTIGDLANYKDLEELKSILGELSSKSLYNRANGIDDAIVDKDAYSESKSISVSHTFDNNIFDPLIITNTLKILSNTLENRMHKENKKALTIGLTLKFTNFRQISRSVAIDSGIYKGRDIYYNLEEVFNDNFNMGDNIRLVGVFATRLVDLDDEVKQLSIFDNMDVANKEVGINKLLNSLKSEFGEDSINLGYYKYKDKEEEKNE